MVRVIYFVSKVFTSMPEYFSKPFLLRAYVFELAGDALHDDEAGVDCERQGDVRPRTKKV